MKKKKKKKCTGTSAASSIKSSIPTLAVCSDVSNFPGVAAKRVTRAGISVICVTATTSTAAALLKYFFYFFILLKKYVDYNNIEHLTKLPFLQHQLAGS